MHLVCTLLITVPALQKHFVNVFFVFAWEFCVEKRRGFLVNFFWSPFPTKRSTKTPRKIRGKFGAKFGAKFGTKIRKIRGTFVLQLFWPKRIPHVHKIVSPQHVRFLPCPSFSCFWFPGFLSLRGLLFCLRYPLGGFKKALLWLRGKFSVQWFGFRLKSQSYRPKGGVTAPKVRVTAGEAPIIRTESPRKGSRMGFRCFYRKPPLKPS